MMQKLLGIFSIMGMILGGLLVYANTAYFPMARGVEVETKMMNQEAMLNIKLDTVIKLLEQK